MKSSKVQLPRPTQLLRPGFASPSFGRRSWVSGLVAEGAEWLFLECTVTFWRSHINNAVHAHIYIYIVIFYIILNLLYYIKIYYIILYLIISYYIILYYIIICYLMLNYIILYHIILYYIILNSTLLYYTLLY